MSRGRARKFRDDDYGIEMTEGRPEPTLPFSMLGDWVMLALQTKKVRHPALSLYWALVAHLNINRAKQGDRTVWPSQDTLAEMLGYSEGNKIAPYLKDLESIDAIEIQKVPVPGGGGRERSHYVIHKSPPPDFDGPESLQDFYADRKARQAAERAATAAAERQAADASAGALGDANLSVTGSSADATSAGFPGAQMSTRPGAQMSTRSGCPNEHPNKTNQQDEENKNEGAYRRPPEPPAVLSAGRVAEVVTSETELVGDQLTAGANLGVAGFAVIDENEFGAHESGGQDEPGESSAVARCDQPGRALMSKRSGKAASDAAPALFASPGARCAPSPGCLSCDGEGWALDPDGSPIEPAVRCDCTNPALSGSQSPADGFWA